MLSRRILLTFCKGKGGGLSAVPKPHIQKYYDKICRLSSDKTEEHLIRSVRIFKQEI